MRHKTFDVLETKAIGDKGQFTALVAVFNNVDRQGDRILPGAFSKSIEAWKASGDPLPVILSHQWADPMSHIGVADPKDIKQTPKGLMIKGTLDIADNPVAAQVYKLMKRRSLREFSIGYDVPRGGEALAEDGAMDLMEIDLFEAGPTLKGANPATELVAVKSAMGVTDDPIPEPPSDADQRRRAEHMEREDIAEQLPETKADPVPTEAEVLRAQLASAQAMSAVSERQLAALKAVLSAPDEADLRKQSDRVERAQIEGDLPKTDTEPAPNPVTVLTDELAQTQARLATATAQLEALQDPDPEPPSESELRKRTDQLDRERTTLPDSTVDPGPSKLDEVRAEVAAATAQLTALSERLVQQAPASEAELRKATDRLERESVSLPETTGEPAPSAVDRLREEMLAATAELKDLIAEQQKPAPPSEAELRKQSDHVERERVVLPDVPPVEPAPSAFDELRAEVTKATAELKDLIEAGQAPPPVAESELRKRADRVARERVTLPDVPPPEPAPSAADLVRAEISAATAELKQMIAEQEHAPASEGALRKATDRLERESVVLPETTEEPAPSPIDALRAEIANTAAELKDRIAEVEKEKPAPVPEGELRKRADRAERERVVLPETTGEPTPDPLDELRTEVREKTAELKQLIEKQAKTPPEADQRKRAERLERERVVLPAIASTPAPDVVDALRAEIAETAAALKAEIAAQKPRTLSTEEDLRRRSALLDRDEVKSRLPASKGDNIGPSPVEQLMEHFDQAMGRLAEISERLDVAQRPEPPSEAELRKRDDRRTRADIAEQLPATNGKGGFEIDHLRELIKFGAKRLVSDLRMQLEDAGTQRYATGAHTYAWVDDFDPDQGWVVYCVCSEDGGTHRFVQVGYTTGTDGVITLAADDTDVVRTTTYRPLNQPTYQAARTETRSADPLRQRSDQTVLEIQSDGASLRKPPAVKEDIPVEPSNETDLRDLSRKVMLQLLTGED